MEYKAFEISLQILVIHTDYMSYVQRLNWIEDRLGKLITDDPSVIETTLQHYGDVVYPEKESVVHRY